MTSAAWETEAIWFALLTFTGESEKMAALED